MKIGMILSNNIDMGSANGDLVSAKQFDKVAKDVLAWHKRKNASKQNIEKKDHRRKDV